MATRSISRTDLVGLQSLSFIRPQSISISISNTKPSTRLYPFFDGVEIGKYITGALIDTVGTYYISTDSVGSWSGTFVVPSMTFNTGSKLIKFQDSKSYSLGNIAGSSVGSASTTFTSAGILETYQTTINNIETIIVTNPVIIDRPADPLGQTFFTHGITGGCFITGIDIFFGSADTAIPITLEIRETVNGYPGPKLAAKHATVSIPGSYFTPDKISVNGSVPTKFSFVKPVYLDENKTYAFVLLANSNAYNVFTSEMGKKSFETGQLIYEQPYIGSMFKSENNVTWTAEQTEDIKFTMYKAKFSTGSAVVPFKVNVPPVLVRGTNFSVTSGSSTVTAKFDFAHGFKNGDKLYLSVKSGFSSRGITTAGLTSGTGFAVTVIDKYTVTFTSGVVATSTGTLEFPGSIDRIDVDSGGTGYGLSPTTINISAPSSGTAATATATVYNGKITAVTVTNTNGIYTSVPTVTVTGSGSGADLVAITESVFSCMIPRQFQSGLTSLSYFEPINTGISTELNCTDYDSGIVQSRSIQKNTKEYLPNNNILKNGYPNYTDESTKVLFTLESSNENVSPFINTSEIPKLFAQDYIVSPEESAVSIISGSWSSGIITFGTNSAHNRIVGDTFYVTSVTPSAYNGVYTVLTVPTSASVTVAKTTTPGSYVSGGSVSDSELTPNSGSSKCRYVSKTIKVVTPSTGAKIFVEAISTIKSSFDVYIKTSLTSSVTNHSDEYWTKLSCDISRNQSANTSDPKDYEFYIDSLSTFDTYSIKIVLHSTVKYEFPRINNYRSILLAS